MAEIKDYKNYFELLDERTPFSLFKKYVLQLIELAEEQQKEIKRFEEKLTQNNKQ